MIAKIEPCENGAHANQSTTPRNIPEGWIEVPAHLQNEFMAAGSFCTLTIEDGVLVAIEPLPIPEPEPVEPVMTTEEATLDMVADIDYRLGLLELGGQEVKL